MRNGPVASTGVGWIVARWSYEVFVGIGNVEVNVAVKKRARTASVAAFACAKHNGVRRPVASPYNTISLRFQQR